MFCYISDSDRHKLIGDTIALCVDLGKSSLFTITLGYDLIKYIIGTEILHRI